MVPCVPLFIVILLIPVLGIPIVGLESSTHVAVDAVGECFEMENENIFRVLQRFGYQHLS
jgi:hypothetical protein